jgi:hypothetical protein
MKLIANTFVLVAPDCSANVGTAPKPRGDKPTIPLLQHRLLIQSPYKLKLEELMYEVHVLREGLTPGQSKNQHSRIQEKLFGKPYPCMRASPLPKSYGWGVHHDGKGRLAIYGVESEDYRRLSASDNGLDVVVAMRTRRDSKPKKRG